MSESIQITSKLAAAQRPALEQLLFFNVNQHRVRLAIQQSIETYGVPEILEHDGELRIRVGDIDGVQTLFAVSDQGRPVGVAVFIRRDNGRFLVLHLGVAPRQHATADVNVPVVLKLLHTIRGAPRPAAGIDRIELVYKHRQVLRDHG